MAITISPDSLSGPSWCSWKNTLSTIHLVVIGLSLYYCKLVYVDAAEACYVEPCYEGPGLEELWKVNKGITFLGKSSGLLCLLYGSLGYFLFRNERVVTLLEHAHFLVGIFAGMTLCASLLTLNLVFLWGAETNLMINLSKLRETNSVLEESDRHMLVVNSLIGVFFKLSVVSAALCFLQCGVLIQLLWSRKDFVKYFRLLSSGGDLASNAMDMIGDTTSEVMDRIGDSENLTANAEAAMDMIGDHEKIPLRLSNVSAAATKKIPGF